MTAPAHPAALSACPVCGQPAVARYRPFCCRRCADVDLHRWLGGVYRIPTEEPAEDGQAMTEQPED